MSVQPIWFAFEPLEIAPPLLNKPAFDQSNFSFQRPRVKSRNKKRNDIETRFMFFSITLKTKVFY